MNISDGRATDGDPEVAARQLALATADGETCSSTPTSLDPGAADRVPVGGERVDRRMPDCCSACPARCRRGCRSGQGRRLRVTPTTAARLQRGPGGRPALDLGTRVTQAMR
jgi:hypothetical protein